MNICILGTVAPKEGAVMRSMAQQTAEERAGPGSVLVRQKLDHIALDVLLDKLQTSRGEDRLEATSLADPDRPALLRRIVDLLRRDVRDEEDELLPQLQDRIGDDELRRLGRRWEAVRRISPTRHHPIVARRPPGNVLVALPLTLLDRASDHLDRGARHTQRSPSAMLPQASRGLQHFTRRVERLAVLGAGERPETHIDHDGSRPR